MNKPLVSIVIPTFKDWERLALCLRALAGQRYPEKLFEIIVINNHATDGIPAGFDLADNCRVIRETTPGSYAARNAAIRVAKGEILGFTDSDCIPDGGWINNAVDYLQENKSCSRIAGKISLFYQADKLTPVELYEQVYAFNQDIYVRKDGTGVTANMFSWKYVFDHVGLFNEQLMSGGDYEWAIRAKTSGYKIDYAEKVLVHHPARFRMKELICKAKRVGGGQAFFLNGHRTYRTDSFARFLYDLRPPLKSLRLIRSKGKKLSFRQKIIVGAIRYYLSVIGAYEKLKVQTGKEPNRI